MSGHHSRYFDDAEALLLFKTLAPAYAPQFIDETSMIEMERTPREICYNLSELEFALCQMQCIEILLLVGNALRLEGGDICYYQGERGAEIQLKLMNSKKWVVQDGPYENNSTIHQNMNQLLLNFCFLKTTKFNEIEQIKNDVLIGSSDEDRHIHFRLMQLALRLVTYIINLNEDNLRAQKLMSRISNLVILWEQQMNSLPWEKN